MAIISYPECGRIIHTHGCHGAVKLEPWCDTPAVLAGLPRVFLKKAEGLVPLAVKKASVFRSFVFAELAGVTTMEAAEALRGTVLYADRNDLGIPDGALLIAELVGLPVRHADTGELLGQVEDVIHPGATDIYVIKTPRGEAMIPAVAEFVVSTHPQEGIAVRPIEGMLP